jgi:hypothetical protein
MLVGDVVGQLELVEGDNLLHPLLPGGGTVRVDVHPLGHLGVRLPSHNPPAAKEMFDILFFTFLHCLFIKTYTQGMPVRYCLTVCR